MINTVLGTDYAPLGVRLLGLFSSFDEMVGLKERPFNRKESDQPRAWPNPESLAKVHSLLKSAEKPIIIGGHGVWWSKSESILKDVALRLLVFLPPPEFISPAFLLAISRKRAVKLTFKSFRKQKRAKY